MAWFETGEDGDISADEVMDDVTDALEALFENPETAPGDLADLLRVWQDALNAGARQILSDAGASAFQLRAEVVEQADAAASPTVRMVVAAPSPSHVAPRARALKALQRVLGTYRDATDRAPRPREVAYALSFSFAETGIAERFRMDERDIHVLVEPLTGEVSP